MPLAPTAFPFPPPKQLSTLQAHYLDTEVSTGAGKTNDQNPGAEAAKGKEAVKGGAQPKDKGKGTEVQPPFKA